jgi:hypothetical protein
MQPVSRQTESYINPMCYTQLVSLHHWWMQPIGISLPRPIQNSSNTQSSKMPLESFRNSNRSFDEEKAKYRISNRSPLGSMHCLKQCIPLENHLHKHKTQSAPIHHYTVRIFSNSAGHRILKSQPKNRHRHPINSVAFIE